MKASLLMASTILLCAPSLWAADAPLSLEDNKAAIIGIQLLGIAACFIWIFGAAYLMFALIAKTIGLRVSPEEKMAGLDRGEHAGSASPDFEASSCVQGWANRRPPLKVTSTGS